MKKEYENKQVYFVGGVYKLLGLDKKVCPVTPHMYDVRTLLKALNTAYR